MQNLKTICFYVSRKLGFVISFADYQLDRSKKGKNFKFQVIIAWSSCDL